MASGVTSLIKGFPGKPLHPPLTDVSIGAYTVGVAMLVLGALGVEQEQMAHGALLAIGGGLVVTLPTALTGLLDWLDLPKRTPRRTMATVHLFVMLAATALFALTFVFQLEGYRDGQVETIAWILGLGGEVLLTAGGYVGGTLVFVYGIRALNQPDTPPLDSLVPGRAGQRPRHRAWGPPSP